jgi:hypothetical protein
VLEDRFADRLGDRRVDLAAIGEQSIDVGFFIHV